MCAIIHSRTSSSHLMFTAGRKPLQRLRFAINSLISPPSPLHRVFGLLLQVPSPDSLYIALQVILLTDNRAEIVR